MLGRKILILGHARHGKDTAAEFLAKELGLNFKGSSEVCAEFIYEKLKDKYDSAQECFEDRGNNRELWYNMIADYCKDDKARLGKLIYATNDIYCGIRAKNEFVAVVEAFDPIVVWIDASERLPLESTMEISKELAQPEITIHNDDSLEHFHFALSTAVKLLREVYNVN